MRTILPAALMSSILLLDTFNAHAQKTAKLPCEKRAHTQNEMNQCAGRAYEKADAEMNRAYQQLKLALSRSGEPYNQKLTQAQQVWLKYREATCECEVALNEGGTNYPMMQNYCLASVTKERTKRLNAMARDIERR
ncbi:MAG: lysozyme inhibitor LprI family protein [Pyrinomonadaceae bacterium]